MTANRLPQGGSAYNSKGEAVNWVDITEFDNRYNLNRQIIVNGAVEIGRRCTVPSAQSTTGYFYAIEIPAGREFFIWVRNLVLSEGIYNVDLVDAPDGWTGGSLAFKRKLNSAGEETANSNIRCGVTPNNTENLETIMQFPQVDTGVGIGSARVGGAAAQLGSLTVLREGAVLIRVARTVSQSFSSSILVVGWEEDIE